MTYCVGVLLEDGIVLGSDSRTHAGVDDFASFCKMTVFEDAGERVLVLLSSGSLAGTQAVISLLRQEADAAADAKADAAPAITIRSAQTMFDVARVGEVRASRSRAADLGRTRVRRSPRLLRHAVSGRRSAPR